MIDDFMQEMCSVRRAHYYSSCDSMVERRADWMRAVPDDTPLGRMTIPGTHDSCAMYGGHLVSCQSLSLRDQLEAGIRFLDIRLRAAYDRLDVHHGIVYQYLSFDDVMSEVGEFLRRQPTEAVIMRIKEEQPPVGTSWYSHVVHEGLCASLAHEEKLCCAARPASLTFAQLVQEGICASLLPLEDASACTPLGALRGKLLVLPNYKARPWPGGALDYSALRCQDDYLVPTVFHIYSRKIPAIVAALEEARTSEALWLHHLSGSSAGCYPYTCARFTNALGIEELQKPARCGYGIIAADYPGPELIAACIKQNPMANG